MSKMKNENKTKIRRSDVVVACMDGDICGFAVHSKKNAQSVTFALTNVPPFARIGAIRKHVDGMK